MTLFIPPPSSDPLISVVVPTHGHGKYIEACLDSIWHQDYSNLEVIVVNAASPDDTGEVLARYAESVDSEMVSYASRYDEKNGSVERIFYPRRPSSGRKLRILTLQNDPGLVGTYNIGLEAATADFVSTVASDDLCHPLMMVRLLKALQDGADFAYSDCLIIDDRGVVVRKFAFPDYDPRVCLGNWYLMGVSRMWRRRLHESCGYMDPAWELAHDYDLILRFAMGGAVLLHVPETLYSIRYHGDDRKTGSHSNDREHRIHRESIEIAERARQWIARLNR